MKLKRILRIAGIIVAIVIVVLIAAGVVFYIQGNKKLNQKRDVQVASLTIPTGDEEAIAEGERIFITRGCDGCHGEDGAGDSFSFLGNRIVVSNLTSGEGGVGGRLEVEDYQLAIQHGLRRDGSPLEGMPAEQWQQMRQQDLVSLIAYLQSLEPVDHVQSNTSLNFIGRILVGTGLLPLAADKIDHDSAGVVVVQSEVSDDFGKLLATQMCTACHGEDLAGGTVREDTTFFVPDITFHEDGIAGWTLDDFVTTLRTGVNPEGQELQDPMPWESLSHLTDDELESLYLYLQSVEPLPQG